jgi:hypothetical protein
MKQFILVFLVLFAIKTQAPQDSPEFRAKIRAMSAKMQKQQSKPQVKTSGKVSYTVNGKTYTETKEISTVIINGKIGDIANDTHNVSIGDGTPHSFKVGQVYSCKSLTLMVDGLQYSRRSKDNVATISYYDGKTVKGKFSGTVYNEKTKKTLSVSGTFETNNVTVL